MSTIDRAKVDSSLKLGGLTDPKIKAGSYVDKSRSPKMFYGKVVVSPQKRKEQRKSKLALFMVPISFRGWR